MNNQQKPPLVHVIAWTTLVSGIVNLFWGFAAISATWWTIVCIPITILPTILGIFELIYAARLFSNPPQAVQPSTNIAVFEIATVLTGNVFSMAVGILSLVFYNDTVVKEYFARLNGTLNVDEVPAEPATPPTPASLPDLEPAPAIEEPATPPTEEAPAAEDKPKKPKRTPRKVAKK